VALDDLAHGPRHRAMTPNYALPPSTAGARLGWNRAAVPAKRMSMDKGLTGVSETPLEASH
jgi:hypothetical protein